MPVDSANWSKLPASRLRAPGARGAGAVAIALRASIAVLALAALWHVFVLVRPLPKPAVAPPDTPGRIAEFEWSPSNLEHRQANLDSLRGINHYAHDRLPWHNDIAGDSQEQSEEITAERPPVHQHAAVGAAPGEIYVDSEDSLPDDVKKARDSLKLRGIRSNFAGRYFAQISLVHTKNPLETMDYRVGDTFTDPKHNSAEWRVAAIDPRRDRVVLERSGKRVALDLYPVLALPLPPALDTISASPAAAGGMHVESKTRAQVVAELLEAEMSTEDIRALLDMIDAESLPEPQRREIPDPEEVVRRMDQAKQQDRSSTTDMALLIQMMSSGQNPVEFMEQRAKEAEAKEASNDQKEK